MIPWHQLYLTGAVLLSPATVALGSRLQHRGSRPSLRVRLSLIIAAAAAWPILLLGTVEMILVIAVGAARRRAAAPAHIPHTTSITPEAIPEAATVSTARGALPPAHATPPKPRA